MGQASKTALQGKTLVAKSGDLNLISDPHGGKRDQLPPLVFLYPHVYMVHLHPFSLHITAEINRI